MYCRAAYEELWGLRFARGCLRAGPNDGAAMSLRVLQSFPHKIGAGRICTTAWHEAAGVAEAGGEVTVIAGAVARPLPPGIDVRTTLSRGRWRIPYKALGDRAFALHDRLVARALPRLAGDIDVVHAWPLAALETLRASKRLGIPTVLERPNAHTRFAYEVVARECERLGVRLPQNQEHAYNDARLLKEEEEYALADRLLCPSEFVAQTFRDQGFHDASLARHQYGYDGHVYHPDARDANRHDGLNVLFVGVCAVRKGLHFALEAWLQSSASRKGKLRIAGAFVPEYRAKLADALAHPSVEVLGHSDDVPALMRASDVLVLPSLEEGFPLVSLEGMASGCVPLMSSACSEAVRHGQNGFVHSVGDVAALSAHLTELDQHRDSLADLRRGCLLSAADYTWSKAGVRLFGAYEETLQRARSAAEAA